MKGYLGVNIEIGDDQMCWKALRTQKYFLYNDFVKTM